MYLAVALAILIVLSLVSALMSAMETVLLCIREHEREALAAKPLSTRQRSAVQLLQDSPERAFDDTLLVGSIANLMLAIAVLIVVRENPFGMRVLPAATILFAGVLLFTDVLPKAVALNRPRSVFLAIGPLLVRLDAAVGKLTTTLGDSCDLLVSKLTPRSLVQNPELTEEELDTLVEMRHEEGALEHEESEVIHEILRLSNRTAKDCMTPRTDAFVISDELSPEEADELIRNQHHWKVPIYHDQPDMITGILDVRSYLDDESPTRDYHDHIGAPVFVPETVNALRLFNDYVTDPVSMVIVLDEYGGFEGVVSATDMLEEFIGDAAPSSLSEEPIHKVTEGQYLTSGAARLDQLGELFDADLERDGLDTIGGLVFNLAGEVPKRGDEFRVAEGIVATVRQSTRHRVEELMVVKTDEDDGKD